MRSVYSEQARKEGLKLITAAEKGDIEAVESLLKKDVYIHAQDKEGKCAIVAAAYINHIEIVDLLIKAGADVNLQDKDGVTPLEHAENKGFTDIIKILRR